MDFQVCQAEGLEFPKNCKNDNLPLLILDSTKGFRCVQSAIVPSIEHALHGRSMHSQFFLTQEAQGLRG
jgi:hypothetical protein